MRTQSEVLVEVERENKRDDERSYNFNNAEIMTWSKKLDNTTDNELIYEEDYYFDGV